MVQLGWHWLENWLLFQLGKNSVHITHSCSVSAVRNLTLISHLGTHLTAAGPIPRLAHPIWLSGDNEQSVVLKGCGIQHCSIPSQPLHTVQWSEAGLAKFQCDNQSIFTWGGGLEIQERLQIIQQIWNLRILWSFMTTVFCKQKIQAKCQYTCSCACASN